MDQRKRLIELLSVAVGDSNLTDSEVKIVADYLLANGVVVPPVSVGARVCVIASQTSDNRNLYIFEDTVTHYRIVDGLTIMCFENHLGEPNWNWDKVFLTREEAEAEIERKKK